MMNSEPEDFMLVNLHKFLSPSKLLFVVMIWFGNSEKGHINFFFILYTILIEFGIIIVKRGKVTGNCD